MAARGFTLLELLVVLAILSVVAVVAGSWIGRDPGTVRAEVAARDVAAALQQTRSAAIVSNVDRTLTIDVEARGVATDDGRFLQLPPRLRLGLYTAQIEQISPSAGRIRFFPDGSSTGGELTLSDVRAEFLVRVEWLTGRVSVVRKPES